MKLIVVEKIRQFKQYWFSLWIIKIIRIENICPVNKTKENQHSLHWMIFFYYNLLLSNFQLILLISFQTNKFSYTQRGRQKSTQIHFNFIRALFWLPRRQFGLREGRRKEGSWFGLLFTALPKATTMHEQKSEEGRRRMHTREGLFWASFHILFDEFCGCGTRIWVNKNNDIIQAFVWIDFCCQRVFIVKVGKNNLLVLSNRIVARFSCNFLF